MPLTNDEIHELAKQAVIDMHAQRGSEFTFPFDLIWQFTPDASEVPSGLRSDKWRRLVSEGFIELTGGMTKAVSAARAGSSTREYRFGPKLKPKPPAIPVTAKKSPSEMAPLLKALQSEMEGGGYVISAAELANFYLAMTVSPLVILSGISGTGKSLLPRQFANRTGSGIHSIPVQPQWSDNSDLFGYVPTLAPGSYVEGRILPALREAWGNPTRLTLALLDEMNLAPVEHYFSDFLSVAETRRRAGAQVVTDRLPIEVPNSIEGLTDSFTELRAAHLPINFRVVGTANMDETTKSFSPKVLDRAFAIEFDDPDLATFATGTPESTPNLADLVTPLLDGTRPISVHEALVTSKDLFDHVASLLTEIQEILSPAGIRFGYRTRDAILLYLYNWRDLGIEGVLSASAALDFCLLQKVLPKVTGTGETLGDALEKLSLWLGTNRSTGAEPSPFGFDGPFERSRQKVERMRDLLESDGATHFWGV